MRQRNRVMVVALIGAGLPLLACQRDSAPVSHTPPAHIEPIDGTELSRLTLTEKATERLDIQMGRVSQMQVSRSGTEPRKVVPYAAVLYDAHGDTWVYTSPEPRTFVRHHIAVDFIEGDVAVLLDGPPLGTEVVTIGGAELLGTEFEVGH